MRDVYEQIVSWRQRGRPVVLATVIKTWGSGPRRPGAKMGIAFGGSSPDDIGIVGSVSGGCVEASVVETAQSVLGSGVAEQISFGVSHESAWEVGLTCGGRIHIFVERLDEDRFRWLVERLEAERAAATLIVVGGETDPLGQWASLDSNGEIAGPLADSPDSLASLRKALAAGVCSFEDELGRESFVDVELPPARMVVVGGGHVSVALSEMARTLGYRVFIVDPREVFANRERFPYVEDLITDWPQQALAALELNRSTAVATLTHDAKLDDPALEIALSSEAFYVGALGSRRTHEKRLARLAEKGIAADALERLHAPIGLAIGSQTPEEIALSIMAEITAARRGALRVSA